MADAHRSERQRLTERLHILEGLLDALGRMDEVDEVVRRSANRPEARQALTTEPFHYSEVVATHILDMTISRQTVGGIEELRREVLQAHSFLDTSEDT